MPLWLFLCIPGYSLFYDKSKRLCNEVISLHSKKYRAGKAIKYQVVGSHTGQRVSHPPSKHRWK